MTAGPTNSSLKLVLCRSDMSYKGHTPAGQPPTRLLRHAHVTSASDSLPPALRHRSTRPASATQILTETAGLSQKYFFVRNAQFISMRQ